MNAKFVDRASMVFSYLLLLMATGMLAWGVLGFLEYFTGQAPLMPLQNSNFPDGTQFLHWLLITATGGTYVFGYLARWKLFPQAMVVLFGMLGTLCAVETFDFMTRESRYSSFVREIIWYIVISTYLLKSRRIQSGLKR